MITMFVTKSQQVYYTITYMKDILKIQVVPIKTLTLEKRWIQPNKDFLPTRHQQSRNIRNFLYLKMMNKNKMDRQPEEKSFSPNLKRPERQRVKRPNTSFDQYYQNKLVGYENKHHTAQNPQSKNSPNLNQQIQTCSVKIQSSTLNFKNYFPLRKTKKNNDPKWHKYCVQKRNSRSQTTSHETSQNNLSIQLRYKNQCTKLKSRLYTPKPYSRRSYSKNRNSQRLHPEISPWSMNNFERQTTVQKQQYFSELPKFY